jgi:hypothetical protein
VVGARPTPVSSRREGSLIARQGSANKTFNADHYQIESKAGTMPLAAMKGALDNLARNAIVRLVELGEVAAARTTA